MKFRFFAIAAAIAAAGSAMPASAEGMDLNEAEIFIENQKHKVDDTGFGSDLLVLAKASDSVSYLLNGVDCDYDQETFRRPCNSVDLTVEVKFGDIDKAAAEKKISVLKGVSGEFTKRTIVIENSQPIDVSRSTAKLEKRLKQLIDFASQFAPQ